MSSTELGKRLLDAANDVGSPYSFCCNFCILCRYGTGRWKFSESATIQMKTERRYQAGCENTEIQRGKYARFDCCNPIGRFFRIQCGALYSAVVFQSKLDRILKT